MILNSDLRHELQIYDQTIQSFKNKKKNNIIPIPNDRDSEEEELEQEQEIPEIILKNKKKIFNERRKSVPTSIYEQNLDIIVSSVNKDEYKFMEDLSSERKTLKPTIIRSEILKRCHSDAEKEFFFMMVLTVKLELQINLGITNSIISDILPQDLWKIYHL
eukprot:535938_1